MAYLWTVLLALGGALIGYTLHIPAGVLIGAMLAVGLISISGKVRIPSIPSQVRSGLQLGLGILLGSQFTPETLATLTDLWQPACISAAIAISTGLVSAFVSYRWMGIEKITAFLGTAPGGLSDMSLIALDMEAQSNTVVLMHLARLISVVVLIPLLVRLVLPTVL